MFIEKSGSSLRNTSIGGPKYSYIFIIFLSWLVPYKTVFFLLNLFWLRNQIVNSNNKSSQRWSNTLNVTISWIITKQFLK